MATHGFPTVAHTRATTFVVSILKKGKESAKRPHAFRDDGFRQAWQGVKGKTGERRRTDARRPLDEPLSSSCRFGGWKVQVKH